MMRGTRDRHARASRPGTQHEAATPERDARGTKKEEQLQHTIDNARTHLSLRLSWSNSEQTRRLARVEGFPFLLFIEKMN
jgi:hypothetical protein